MDATLDQLFASFEITPEEKWLQACPAVIASVHNSCACGLDPLQRYFTAGEEALHAVAGSLLGTEMADLLTRYRLLSRREFEAACQACKRQNLPEYCILAGKNAASSWSAASNPAAPGAERR